MGGRPAFGLNPADVIKATDSELELARDVLVSAKKEVLIDDGVLLQKFVEELRIAQFAIDSKHYYLGGAPGSPVGVVEVGQGSALGFYRVYEQGAIYWRRDIGAFWVHGSIYDKYQALHAEAGLLGYPKTDETGVPDGVGRFNHFEGGSIYWHPSTGAFEVHGAIRDSWSAQGWEASFLGYPVSDEHYADGWRVSNFQNGTIRWSSNDGINVAPAQFVVDAPSIVFGTGIAIGGNGTLVVYSDGTTHFFGHLHASGWPSYDCLAVFTVKDADGRAYAASQSGRVHGSDESGSRDLDWDAWSTDDDVRKNWPRIRDGGVGGYKVDVTSDWSPVKIGEDVLAVVGFVISVIGLFFGGGSSSKSDDPNYGRPEDYPPGGEPPPPGATGDDPPGTFAGGNNP